MENMNSTNHSIRAIAYPKTSLMNLFSSRILRVNALIFLLLALGTGSLWSQSFDQNNLDFNGNPGVNNATSLEFGPDGNLYVAEENGLVKIYTIQRNGLADYSVTDSEVLTLVQSIPNHDDDDGGLGGPSNRQVTGITVGGTAADPVVYVSSSDRRRGAGGGGGDSGLDTNSGVITRLKKNGGNWQAVDMVRGLPRSEENHATNGMQLVTIGAKDWLLVSNGGFTNAGSPSNNFAYITEYALSGAVLALDLQALEAMPVLTDGSRSYIYDLPTLDDPTRVNANGIEDPDASGYDGVDINDPFGGNDGLNMAMLVPGSPVKMFSPGYRNSYDLVVTEDRNVYVTDNGANGGWGGFPEFEGNSNLVNNNYRPGEPGSTGSDAAPNSTPFDAQVNNSDHLNLVTTNIDSYVFGSVYGGHPCPVRANANAGLFTRGAHSAGGAGQAFSDSYFRTERYDPNGSRNNSESDPLKALPANWPPVDVSLLNSDNADFRQPTLSPNQNPDGPDDIIVVNWGNNTNGIAEYTASNFGGVMKGDLIAGKGGNLHRVDRDASNGSILNVEQNKFSVNGNALGVDCQGDSDIFPGTIWVANYDGDGIVILEPNDFVICVLPGDSGYNPLGDNDADGYTNDDEAQNGTDMCSGASKPTDFDKDLVSDLLDLDDDGDGINDNVDPLQLGAAFDLPVENELFLGTDLGGYLGLGFTGLMNNGDPNPNYQSWQDDPLASDTDTDDILGGAIGATTMFQTTGDAANNDQEKAYQYGINVDSGSGTFMVQGRMFPPFNNFSATESQGMFIGDGFQDDYVKLVLGQNNEISVVGENNGTPVTYVPSTSIGFSPSTTTNNLDLYLVVNSATGSVQARYAIDDGVTNDVGASFTLEGKVLTALQSSSQALIVGMIGTADTDDGYGANWDFLNVAGNTPFVVQQISDLDRTIGAASDVIGLDSYFADDTGVENLVFSVEENTDTSIGTSISGNNLTIIYPTGTASTSITVRATDADNFFVEQTFNVNVNDPPSVLFRVNAGDALVAATDAPNPDWAANTGIGAQSGTGFSVNTGNLSTHNTTGRHPSVPDYAPQALFAKERWDPAEGDEMQWTFNTGNGTFTVNLYMANGYAGTADPGTRIFDVKMEGALTVDNKDLSAQYGSGVGAMESYQVTVSDGVLNIEFIHQTENPLINAIEILGNGGTVDSPITLTPVANQSNTLGETPVLSIVANGGDNNETFTFETTGLPPGLTIEPTNGSILGTISSAPSDAGSYMVEITVSKPSSTPVTDTFTWTVTDPNVSNAILYRVNAGGALTNATDGSPKNWEEDQSAATANGNAATGTPSTYVNNTIQDLTYGAALPGAFVNNTGYPNSLFTTERYNSNPAPTNMQWDFPVANGTYTVNLIFAEVWTGAQAAGVRVFDVVIEENTVLDNFDQTAMFGWANAGVETFTVNVNDGNLDIDFIMGVQNPNIKAIEILGGGTPPVSELWTDQTDDENYTARHECSFVQAGENFYLFGGRENPANLDVYDYKSKTWSTIANSAPSDFNHFQALEYNGLIWVIGAFKDNGFPNETPADFVYAYNPATDSWIQGPAVPAGRKRGSAGLVVYNNKFYIVAGNTIGHNGGYIPWFDEFDPATGTWTVLDDAPRARDHFHAAVMGDKLYVAGGRQSGPSPEAVFEPLIPEVDVYDFTSGTWSTLPSTQNIPTPRAAASVAVFQNELFVIGGEIGKDLQGNTIDDAQKTTESFDPVTGNWSARADLITERHGTQAIVSGDGIHLTAGSNTKGGGGKMKNMEFFGTDNPTGVALVAGQLTAPTSVEVPVGASETLSLTHSSGNTGVIVTNVELTGADAGEFTIENTVGFNLINPGQSLDLTVTHTGTEEGKMAALTVTYDDGTTVVVPVSSGQGVSSTTVLYRVNTGGPLVTATDSPKPDWTVDTGNSGATGNSTYLAAISTGGSTYAQTSANAYTGAIDMTDPSLPPGTPSSIFQTERYDAASDPEMLWQFPVTSGTQVEIRLYFAELYNGITEAGQRVFDVSVEGTVPPAFDNIDPFGTTGPLGAFMVSHVLIVTDGTLDLEFIHGVENPALKAIEIIDVTDAETGLEPVVTNPGAQIGVEGDLVNFPIIATDGNTVACGPLTYSAENLPENLAIDPVTGVISGTLLQGTGSGTAGAFIEENGIVVIEMESADNLPGNWVKAAQATSPNVNSPGSATGGDFIVWEGQQSLGSQGNGLINYPIEITTPGVYRFQWRNQVGLGTTSTDYNDTWLKIDADAFYGQKGSGGAIVCPIGFTGSSNDCSGNTPQGAGGNGWFKIYSSGATNWSWSTNTSDNDPHQIYARFDAPGIYNIAVSARSSNHVIDRMVLSHVTEYSGNPQSTSIAESQRAVGALAGASADSPYEVLVTVTDACVPPLSTEVAFTWNITATDIGNPSANVTVTGGSGLGSSTFGDNSFVIQNTGDDDIVNITINTTTGFMQDVVFDPVGTAGDAVAKCLTTGNGGNTATQVGITVPANGGSDTEDCVSVFDQLHNGVDIEEGYDILSLDFTDFNPGESYNFGVDMDPTTIKGDLTSGDAGSISGFELIGATISIKFASGVVYTSSLFDEGSTGGSDAIIDKISNALVAPSLSVDGSDTSRLVTSANQTVQVIGEPNASVTLLRVDGRLYIDPGNPSVGYDIDLFEANEAMAKELYTVQLNGSGTADIPVTLTQTTGATGTPNGGLNHFIAVVNGPAGENSSASNVIVLEFDPVAIIGPSVLVEITPDGDLDASTYGASSLQITNNSTGGLQITGVIIDLSTGILPDIVFDPTGAGGDATASCFTPNTGATQVGLITPTDPCADPFSQPRNGGFDQMSLDFTEFDPGEYFAFTTDIDPNSIQGVPGAGAAGAVSGYELIGATVTITFSDNSTLISTIYEDGSLGGGQTIVAANAPVAPSISVVGLGAGPATVNALNQTVTVSGTAGDVVSLLVMDSRLYIASNDPPFNVSDPTYYANEAMSGKALYTGLIGAGGILEIPVTLLQTQYGNGTPDGGLNQLVAVSSNGAYAADKPVSRISNVITLLYDPNAVLTGDVTLSYSMQGRTDYTVDLTVDVYPQGSTTPAYQFTPTGTAAGEAVVTGMAPGTYEVAIKSSNYLQAVETIIVVSGANTLDMGELKAGDANNDNKVSLEDSSITSGTFNVLPGGTGFDIRADFNGDGKVTLEDFSLMAGNFNTAGDTLE